MQQIFTSEALRKWVDFQRAKPTTVLGCMSQNKEPYENFKKTNFQGKTKRFKWNLSPRPPDCESSPLPLCSISHKGNWAKKVVKS